MRQTILDFNKQFGFKPVIVNKEKLKKTGRFVLLGMGGSHLAGDIIKNVLPELPFRIHKDYGLPAVLAKDIPDTLFIASSYSGNTEETISGAKEAFSKGYNLVCISCGGALIDFAKENNLPYIQMTDTGIQPRMALGFSLISLAYVIGDTDLIAKLHGLEHSIDPASFEEKGKALAEKLRGFVPIIYVSGMNRSIGYNWKIKFNETGKIPAFYNVFPELNHNEMTGFDVVADTKPLSKGFHFIFIEDSEDHPMIAKRMKVCKKLLEERELKTVTLELAGQGRLERILSSLLVADFAAMNTAIGYCAEPEQVPMVEKFKKLIAE